jgi:hypothetical protein
MVRIQLLFSQHSPDSRMSDTHLHWYPSCADTSTFVYNIQNSFHFFRSRRSWSSAVGNTRCKIAILTNAAMDANTNVFLSGHLCSGYFSWHKRRVTPVLPSAKPYTKCVTVSSWFEHTVSATCTHHTLKTQLLYTFCLLSFGNFPRLYRTDATTVLM